MNMENLRIRQRIAEERLTFKAVAEVMGIRADGLSRALRLPLTAAMNKRIMAAIDKRIAERGGAER
ncbi:MAG: hypothetical protein II920_07485 [Clostridia bacterium]|nr:hypothetical protein [Clostridia bacterium]